jgi:hypothetical protein
MVAACGGEPAAPELAPDFARSTKAPIHIVSGGGLIDFSPQFLVQENYGFSATIDADGRVRGEFQSDFAVPDVVMHAKVTCLAVDGNDAWIGMVVTQTQDEGLLALGTEAILRVQDNGANGDTPDKIGFWVSSGAGFADLCVFKPTGGFWDTFFDWTHGNVTVQ